MFRNKWIYPILIAVLFVALIALQHYAPKPIDWKATYNQNSKSPYGCYVLNDLLKTVFPGQKITNNEAGFFVSLDSSDMESENLVVITSLFNPDQFDLDALLKFVSNGNNVFVSATDFSKNFLDKLDVELFVPALDTSIFKMGSEVEYLENNTGQGDSIYHFNKKMPIVSFSKFDSITTHVLGTDRFHQPNFVEMHYGSGKIYLHSQPMVFTNYHLLYGNVFYASAVLSCLPVQKTVWDNYYKPDRLINSSPTRYILSQPPLRTAFQLLMLTVLLYMLLESKRKQRIIPVIHPPENQSLQFVKTIGNLYFKQHNNADLTKKKIIFLKEFIRERYYLNTITNSADDIQQLVAKSGLPVKQIKKLLESVKYYQTAGTVTDDGLIELNKRIEQFYEQCL